MAMYSKNLKEYINPANLDKKRRESSATTYRVKRGDTLGAIARKHGVSVSSLMRWNKLRSADRIREGQILRIERTR
ncbi:MAG: LysM peptidoglycan-binding domain-containing protein [Alistipes sp.]|nr:LysM peptidoglycan-binding domain-containing protein [Alistipes sp.]